MRKNDTLASLKSRAQHERVRVPLQINARGSMAMYVKSSLILLGLAVTFYATFFGSYNFWVCVEPVPQHYPPLRSCALITVVFACRCLLSLLSSLGSAWQRSGSAYSMMPIMVHTQRTAGLSMHWAPHLMLLGPPHSCGSSSMSLGTIHTQMWRALIQTSE